MQAKPKVNLNFFFLKKLSWYNILPFSISEGNWQHFCMWFKWLLQANTCFCSKGRKVGRLYFRRPDGTYGYRPLCFRHKSAPCLLEATETRRANTCSYTSFNFDLQTQAPEDEVIRARPWPSFLRATLHQSCLNSTCLLISKYVLLGRMKASVGPWIWSNHEYCSFPLSLTFCPEPTSDTFSSI